MTTNLNFEKGNIYKVSNYKIGKFVNKVNKEDKYIYCSHRDRHNYYKPSTKEDYDKMNNLTNKKYDYEVVHCKNEKEWNYVREKTTDEFTFDWVRSKKQFPEEELAIGINGKCWARLVYYQLKNSLILSFEEWCTKFNHKPNFNKTENMEDILELAKQKYPIGTKFKCVKDNQCGISISEIQIDGVGDYYSTFNDNRCNQYVYVKSKNQWAEIISLPETEKWIPKVGDWVIWKNDKFNKAYKLTFYNELSKGFKVNHGNGDYSKSNIFEICRKALPHEIPKESNNTVLGVELIDGGYYKIIEKNNKEWIFVFKKLENDVIFGNYFMSESYFYKDSNNGIMRTNCIKLIEPASFSERLWLDKCNQLGKFISKDEALRPRPLEPRNAGMSMRDSVKEKVTSWDFMEFQPEPGIVWEASYKNSYIMSCDPALDKIEFPETKLKFINIDDEVELKVKPVVKTKTELNFINN
jgi:hypothetical protein